MTLRPTLLALALMLSPLPALAADAPAKYRSAQEILAASPDSDWHVPAADIRRLLSERPEAIGLAVPGMPYGSPGMGSEDDREAYAVFLIRRDGSAEVFSEYEQLG